MSDLRRFGTWATRDIASGKLEYEWYIHPLNDYSFAEYMKTKQVIWGEYRKWDNRTKWIPTSAIFPSLIRHVEVLKLLMKWVKVREYKDNWEVKWSVWECSIEWAEEKNIIQELNAIRFNTEAMKLNYLTNNHHNIVEEKVSKQEPTEQKQVIFDHRFREEVKKQRYFTIEADPKERIVSWLSRTVYTYIWDNKFIVVYVDEKWDNRLFTIVPDCYISKEIKELLVWQTCLLEWYYLRDYERACNCLEKR